MTTEVDIAPVDTVSAPVASVLPPEPATEVLTRKERLSWLEKISEQGMSIVAYDANIVDGTVLQLGSPNGPKRLMLVDEDQLWRYKGPFNPFRTGLRTGLKWLASHAPLVALVAAAVLYALASAAYERALSPFGLTATDAGYTYQDRVLAAGTIAASGLSDMARHWPSGLVLLVAMAAGSAVATWATTRSEGRRPPWRSLMRETWDSLVPLIPVAVLLLALFHIGSSFQSALTTGTDLKGRLDSGRSVSLVDPLTLAAGDICGCEALRLNVPLVDLDADAEDDVYDLYFRLGSNGSTVWLYDPYSKVVSSIPADTQMTILPDNDAQIDG